jgi:hypothetical protein
MNLVAISKGLYCEGLEVVLIELPQVVIFELVSIIFQEFEVYKLSKFVLINII